MTTAYYKNNSRKQSGFTLIELLIVILVIGALSGVLLGVINSSGVRAKARDSQRKADLTKIGTALELYFSDNRNYPTSAWVEVTGSGAMETALAGYLDPVPVDPEFTAATGNADPCGNNATYRYNYYSDGSVYVLTAIMEIETSKDDSPCTTSSIITDATSCGATFNTQDVCYFVKNP